MKPLVLLVALLLTGCATSASYDSRLFGDSDAGKAAAIAADAAVTWEMWKLLGHVK